MLGIQRATFYNFKYLEDEVLDKVMQATYNFRADI